MGSSKQSTNEATTTQIDPQLKEMYLTNYQNAVGVGQGVSSMGPYTGPRVADPTQAFGTGAQIMSDSARTIAGEIPPWASGQTVQRAEGWTNDVINRANEAFNPAGAVQAYGYDPSPFYASPASVQGTQADVYSMDRNGVRDMSAGLTPREQIRDVNNPAIDRQYIRDVNGPTMGRELIRDVNNPNVDRSLVRDVNNPNVDRSLVRDVNFTGGPGPGSIRDISAGTIASGMAPYTNAYTDQVVDRGLLDLNRARKIAMQGVGAQAARAGAFGGARHGVMEAETNRGFADAAATMAARERANAFNVAGQLSQADQQAALEAGKSNQAADSTLAGMRQQARIAEGTQNQAADLTMAGLRQQAGLETGKANQAADITMAGLRQQAGLETGRLNQAADLGFAGLQQQAALEAGKSNQAADISAAGLQQQAALEAGKANQAADLSTADMYQRGILQAGAANQNMDYSVGKASMDALNAGAAANADRIQQANMASAGYGQQSALANQASANTAAQFNAGQQQAASGANAQAKYQSISQILQAIQQAQALAQMQYTLPQDAASRMIGLDQYARGITNEQNAAAQQAWDDARYQYLPALQIAGGALGMQLPNLGMSSTGKSTTTYSPSGLQTIGQLAGLAGMFAK